MNLHLFIPSLFWSDTSFSEIYHDLSTPSLQTLLAKSKFTKSSSNDINAWLCQAFNIEKQLDWPIAPLMQQWEASSQDLESNRDYWLRVDPVHLRIEQNHIMLADSHIVQLTHEEAHLFSEVINQLLANYNFMLLPLHPQRWYIRLPAKPDLQTNTLYTASCKNINNLLPAGNDSIRWHKIINEIQMLLHDHPLNQQRANRDQLAVNSIWPWGGGFMPQTKQSLYTSIWSDNHLTNALGKWSDVHCNQLPSNAITLLKAINSKNNLVVLDELLGDEKYKDAYNWRKKMLHLEQSWFNPLYTALKNHQIKSLRISSLNENHSHDFLITPSSLWKFWSTIKPLYFYADKY